MAEPSIKKVICVDCGARFDGTARATRCTPCRAEHRRVKGCERQRAWRAARPKQEHADPICQDCGTAFEHSARDGRRTKKFCEPCRLERVRVNTLESTRRRRAAIGPMPRTCLDCPADITGTPARTVRCKPCSIAHRTAEMRAYQKQYRQDHHVPAKFFCKTCSVPIERKGGSGVAHYCDPCRDVAAKASQRRAVAKREKRYRRSAPVTHCHYCGFEYETPRQRTRVPSRCDECKRQVLYAYKRSLTTTNRPAVAPCRDCGTPVAVKRKGPKSIRCTSCAKVAQKAKWLEYAQIYRHMRRAWKYASGYERFSPKEIYERDRWRCGVCRKQISRKLRHPNPKSVSLDHKISLSRGGPHSRANTQAAHLICNIRKNRYDALPGEQMPLPIVFP